METLCHLLDSAQAESACRIHAQFLVTSQSQIVSGNFFITNGKWWVYVF